MTMTDDVDGHEVEDEAYRKNATVDFSAVTIEKVVGQNMNSCVESERLQQVLPEADGLVFDCDGTLLDSMPMYYESWKRSCAELGLVFPIERFYSNAGRTVTDIFQMLLDEQYKGKGVGRRDGAGESDGDVRNNNDESKSPETKSSERCDHHGQKQNNVTAEYCEAVKRRHHEDIQAEGHMPKPVDVVVDIALRYHGKIPMAVASSGWRDHVVSGLKHAGIIHLFDAIVTADEDDVANPKPAPDIFLVAAERIGVCPTKCVGFEDADLGMEGLKSARYLYASDVREMHMYPRNVERRTQVDAEE